MNQATPELERRAEIGQERRARTRAKIIAAAFRLFGNESGLYSRIEDIASEAGVTRATFYNHFSGMRELREAISYELTHDFFNAVKATIARIEDPRQRITCGIRIVIRRARADREWAWSIVNISANGIILGAEAFEQAEQIVIEGMEAGKLRLRNSAIGRDIVLGTCLAAISSMLRHEVPDDYPELIAGHILTGMGVPFEEARDIATGPLPELLSPDQT